LAELFTIFLLNLSSLFSSTTLTQPIMANQKREAAQVQPQDATLISLVLQSLGVYEYDPKVVQQLLEFAHRKLLPWWINKHSMIV
jgi:hypothetical protein